MHKIWPEKRQCFRADMDRTLALCIGKGNTFHNKNCHQCKMVSYHPQTFTMAGLNL
jgi:hypothetical protein